MDLAIVDLSEANLHLLFDWSRRARGQDAGCRFCLYWEEPDRAKWPESLEEREWLKRQWLRDVEAEFGACGKLALRGSEAVGYTQFSAPRYLPNVAGYACGPPSDDTVFVSCLFVPERQRGKGIGSAVLQVILDDLRGRSVSSVEAYVLKDSANNPSGPLSFWLKHGFYILREDEHFALVHKELREE